MLLPERNGESRRYHFVATVRTFDVPGKEAEEVAERDEPGSERLANSLYI